MDFLEEYGLLVAIGLPIALVTVANVYLALTGERGTLLLPGPPGFAPDSIGLPPDEDGAESTASGGA